MSTDTKKQKNASTDSVLNTTPMAAESKTELLDFHTCMARLRAISGETRNSKALAHFGIPHSTYSNWLRRRRINTTILVEALLEHGTSLDGFYAPNRLLTYPTGLVESQVLGINEDHSDLSGIQLTIKAMTRIDAVLGELGIECSASEKELLIETYLGQRDEMVSLSYALRQVAKALRHQSN